MIELLVGADDRTGALETAGACADAGFGMVEVVPREATRARGDGRAVLVVDLASRHLDAAVAAGHAAALEQVPARRHTHKIDSTLRGSWAVELVARHRASGRAVLVVPAFPAVGRTCVGGVVFDHGRPVSDGAAGRDPRMPLRSSCPADHVRVAGAADVVELAGASAIATWLVEGRPGFAICDAASAEDLDALGRAWAVHPAVLLAGTSASIGAAAVALREPAGSPCPSPAIAPPVLVVCGSLHPAARAQVAALVAAGAACGVPGGPSEWAIDALRAGRMAIVSSPEPDASLLPEAEAIAMAASLAATARQLAEAVRLGTLVVIGGDVAAAVLDSEAMLVGGTVMPGVPWCRRAGGDGSLILTRAGGFGGPTALVDLLSGALLP